MELKFRTLSASSRPSSRLPGWSESSQSKCTSSLKVCQPHSSPDGNQKEELNMLKPEDTMHHTLATQSDA